MKVVIRISVFCFNQGHLGTVRRNQHIAINRKLMDIISCRCMLVKITLVGTGKMVLPEVF